jgi:hypothetical protein
VDSGYSIDNFSMLRLGEAEKFGEDVDGAPARTHLDVPQPNPGKDGFRISFTLTVDDWVQLDLYDIKGRRVASVLEGFTKAGYHEAVWDPGSDPALRLSPGLYFIRLVTTTEVATVKLLHL